MTQSEFNQLVSEVQNIQFLIITNGGMAVKSLVEKLMMQRYGLTSGDARELTNYAESKANQAFVISRDGTTWLLKRDEPKLEDYPELQKVKFLKSGRYTFTE